MANKLSFIRMRTGCEEHPSVVRLCELLDEPNAFLYVVRIITYAAQWFGKPSFPANFRNSVERAAKWRKAEGLLEQALEEVGLIKRLPSGDVDIVAWRLFVFRLPSSWSKAAYPEVYERDCWQCRYCGATEETATLSIDHVVPRLFGGSDHADNLVVACKPCNSRKSARTPEEAGMTLLPVPGEAGDEP